MSEDAGLAGAGAGHDERRTGAVAGRRFLLGIEHRKKGFHGIDRNIPFCYRGGDMAIKVLDFWAAWCPPCNVMKPTIEELEKELAGTAEFVAYDVDAQGEMAQKYGVMSIPTYVIEKDGKEVARTTGARPKEEFKRWVEEQL